MKALQAIKTSVWLSVLFLVVYCGTNWLTSLRHDVGVMVFDWEKYLPFMPWLIVPYMSIDLFFVVAPFLCNDENGRRIFARRVTLAILAAAACFLLFPLRFSFERPSTGGWLGIVFDSFREMDRPYNQLPSLHIGLLVILADVYFRRARGVVRTLIGVWFGLIGISTVLTYQHHVVDVAGGFLLGSLCFHIFPEERPAGESNRNSRVGGYYGVASIVTLACGLVLLPWGVFLIWPAGGLAMVACAYFGSGAGIFRKSKGRIPWSTRVWLAPVLIGQQLSLLYYRRQCRPWDEVCPGLWIGRKLVESEARVVIEQGVVAVLDLTGEFDECPSFLRLPYLNLSVLDLTAPTRGHFTQALEFIEKHNVRGNVYVHCKIGYSRSAAIAMAWLMASGRAATTAEAVSILHVARPAVVIRPEIIPAVEEFIVQVRGR